MAQCTRDFELLDQEGSRILWTFTNLFPGCLIKSIDVRAKKNYFWDQMKLPNRHWLAANKMEEAFNQMGSSIPNFLKNLGFLLQSFSTRTHNSKKTLDPNNISMSSRACWPMALQHFSLFSNQDSFLRSAFHMDCSLDIDDGFVFPFFESFQVTATP